MGRAAKEDADSLSCSCCAPEIGRIVGMHGRAYGCFLIDNCCYYCLLEETLVIAIVMLSAYHTVVTVGGRDIAGCMEYTVFGCRMWMKKA